MRKTFFPVIIILAFLQLTYGQDKAESDFNQAASTFYQLSDVEKKYELIDSLYTAFQIPIDSLSAAMVRESVDEKLLQKDTADVMEISLSWMHYYLEQNVLDSVHQIYSRIKNYVEENQSLEIGLILLSMGNAYYGDGMLEKSYRYYIKAAEMLESTENTDFLEYGDAYAYAGDNMVTIGKYGVAAQHLEKAREIYWSQADTTDYLWASYNYVRILGDLALRENIKNILPQLISIAQSSDDYDVLSAFYAIMVEDFLSNKEYEKALKYARMMIELCPYTELNVHCSYSYHLLCLTFIEVGELDSANYYYDYFKEIYSISNNNYIDEYNYYALAIELAFANGNIEKAEALLHENFLPYNDLPGANFKINASRHQYLIDEAKTDYASAIRQYQKMNEIKDSVFHRVLENQFAYYQTLFESNKRKQRIAEQERRIAQLELAHKQKRYIWLGIVWMAMLIATIITLIQMRNNERKLKAKEEKYGRKLLVAQDEERSRIARQLHEGVGQNLAMVKNMLNSKKDSESGEFISHAIEEIRSLTYGLTPAVLRNLGLTASLSEVVSQAEKVGTIFFEIDIDDVDGILPRTYELNIYRIVQEAITNMLKYSDAEAAKLKIKKKKDSIEVAIIDFGKGFDIDEIQDEMGLGMQTIKERVKMIHGKVSILSQKAKGTEITVSIPIVDKEH